MTINIGSGITIGGGITLDTSSGGGGSGTTYLESSTTFNGTFGPPWVVTSLYNSGHSFSIRTNNTPSSQFIDAINALHSGSVLTIIDGNAGTVTITFTSGFDQTYTTAGNEYFTASCNATSVDTLYQITSITIS